MASPDNTSEQGAADLSALSSLSIGPEWATSETPRQPSVPKHFREERGERGGFRGRERDGGGDGRRFGGSGNHPPRRDHPGGGSGFGGGGFGGDSRGGHSFNRDRRGGDSRGGGGARFGDRNSGDRRGGDGGFRRPPAFPTDGGFDGQANGGFPNSDFPSRGFRPTPVVEIFFYPEDKPFNVLIKAVKASLRTYELFEIASLILEKDDRFIVVCHPFDAEQRPDARLYQSVPDGLPFLSETDATAHVLRNHLDRFCDQESVTIEPPKGSFQMVSRCGFTGEILGPPNYHGYQQTLREHHAARLSNMAFERFTSRIESVRAKEEIDRWLQSKTQITRYTLKKVPEGAETAPSFDSLDALRNHLLANCKGEIVKAVAQARFPGRNIPSLPVGPLRSAVENELARQRRHPLTFSNFLRGRLRKLGFVIYKRGSKDITYVSAVERKFRQPGAVFADSIQRVFDFIEQRSNRKPFVKFAELPEKFLGILPDEPTPAGNVAAPSASSGTPEEVAVAVDSSHATAPAEMTPAPAEEVPAATVLESAEAIPEAATPAAGEATAAEEPVASEAPAPEVASESNAESAPAPQVAAPAAPAVAALAATPPRKSSAQSLDLNDPAIRELFNNVRWLVSEGYVTEFSDGGLFANPVRATSNAQPAVAEPAPASDAASVAASATPAFPNARPQKKKHAGQDRRQRRSANPASVASAAGNATGEAEKPAAEAPAEPVAVTTEEPAVTTTEEPTTPEVQPESPANTEPPADAATDVSVETVAPEAQTEAAPPAVSDIPADA